MDIKECPKCPHGEFLMRCMICNGGEICIHGRLSIVCPPCVEIKRYMKN